MTTFHVNPKASLYTPPAPKVPTLEVKAFKPIFTNRWVCVYGTNGSPRDRMRHDAQYAGERPLTHPYTRIMEAR